MPNDINLIAVIAANSGLAMVFGFHCYALSYAVIGWLSAYRHHD
ncbi:hypothetical protein [Nitrosomonas communis]|nr:hypothetical protein [Nitrosomonas communis]